MTKECAKKFLDRVEKDPLFRESLHKATARNERKKILAQNNLLFTRKDYVEAYQEKYHRHLSEEEMKLIVAAGAHKTPSSINFNTEFKD